MYHLGWTCWVVMDLSPNLFAALTLFYPVLAFENDINDIS